MKVPWKQRKYATRRLLVVSHIRTYVRTKKNGHARRTKNEQLPKRATMILLFNGWHHIFIKSIAICLLPFWFCNDCATCLLLLVVFSYDIIDLSFVFWNTTRISNLLLNSLLIFFPGPVTFLFNLCIASYWTILAYSIWFMDSLEKICQKRPVPVDEA